MSGAAQGSSFRLKYDFGGNEKRHETSSGYLDSAVFAVVVVAAGLLVGCLSSLIVLFVLLRFSSRSKFLGSWLIAVYLTVFPPLCGILCGVFGFPLCGIWLDSDASAKNSCH